MRWYNTTTSGKRGDGWNVSAEKVESTIRRHGELTRVQLQRLIPESNATMINKIISRLKKEGKVEAVRDGTIVIYRWLGWPQ